MSFAAVWGHRLVQVVAYPMKLDATRVADIQ